MATAEHTDIVETLADALTASQDAKTGFDKMVEKAEPEFRPVVKQFSQLHADHNHRLAALLRRHGETPDTDGSFQGTINKVVVATRAFFDEIDGDVMDNIRDGEDNVCDKYVKAAAISVDANDRAELQAMHNEIKALMARTSGVS